MPEILIVVLAISILGIEMILNEEQRRNLGWVSAVGLFIILGISLIVARPGDVPRLAWGGMVRQDWMSFIFKMMFIFGAGITSLLPWI